MSPRTPGMIWPMITAKLPCRANHRFGLSRSDGRSGSAPTTDPIVPAMITAASDILPRDDAKPASGMMSSDGGGSTAFSIAMSSATP